MKASDLRPFVERLNLPQPIESWWSDGDRARLTVLNHSGALAALAEACERRVRAGDRLPVEIAEALAAMHAVPAAVPPPSPPARTTRAPLRLHDLLTPTDPDVIGWAAGELLYAEPEIRAKATHVVELLPFNRPSVLHTFDPKSSRPPKGLLAVLEVDGGALVSFVALEWVAGPGDEPDDQGGRRATPALYQPLFHGEGPGAPLRELRHTHWGHADDGYLHDPNGALIAAAFEALKRWFDCWRRT